jgi:hypothetical protein
MKSKSFQKDFILEAVSYQAARFPLTLTLSRGERGQPLNVFLKLFGHRVEFSRRFAKNLGAFLPLGWGEGRGEGKPTNQNSTLANKL